MPRLERLFDRYRRRHEPEALASVFDETAPGLLRLALHLTGDPVRAEDLLQQTFLTALERADQFDATRALRPWLAGILRNHARDLQRRVRRDHALPLVDNIAAGEDLDAALDGLVWDARLASLVEELPDHHRQVLVLRLRHGLSPAEIADVLGKPPATVRSHLHRGVTVLRERLTSREVPTGLAVLPSLRGVDGVRTQVVGEASRLSALAATAALASGGIVGGAFVMPKVMPWIAGLGASLLLVGGLIVSGVIDFGGGEDGTKEGGLLTHEGKTEGGPELAAREGEKPDEDPEAEPEMLHASFDLARVDREADVHGIVVDQQGRGIAGAELTIVLLPWRNAELWTRGIGSKTVPGPKGRSAQDGTFHLPWARTRWGRLDVRAPGFAPLRYDEVQAGEKLRIELAPAVALTVTVKDGDGQPVPEAKISASRWAWLDQPSITPSATTDGEGVARLEGIPQGWPLRLRAQAKGFIQQRNIRATLPETGDGTHDVTLVRGERGTGRVLDHETGEPLAGVSLHLGWRGALLGTSDEEGRFDVVGLAFEGHSPLVAKHPDYAWEAKHARPGSQTELRLQRASALSGRVVDGQGKGVAGARIGAIGSDFATQHQRLSFEAIEADEAGRFEIGGLHPEMAHTLVILADGLGRRLFDFDAVAAGTVKDVGVLRLGAPHVVEGTVMTNREEPVAGVRIVLVGSNQDRASTRVAGKGPAQEHYGAELSRRTDDLGRFRFADVCPGTYSILVRGDAGQDVQQPVTVPEDQAVVKVAIEIGATRKVHVRVVDGDGAPVTDVYVHANYEGNLGGHGKGVADDGTVTFEIPHGTKARFHANGNEGSGLLRGEGGEVDAEGDETTIVMQRGRVTSGVVLDPEGKPVPGAIVRAHVPDDKRWYSGRGDGKGQFTITLPAGVTAALEFKGRTVNTMGGSIDEQTLPFTGRLEGVASGTKDVRLETRRDESLGSVTFVITEPGGKPVEWVSVNYGSGHGRTNKQGRIELHNLDKKEHTFRFFDQMVRKRPWLVPEPKTLVPEGQTVELQMRTAHVVEGRVLKPNGQGAASCTVEGFVGDESVAKTWTGSDGSFRLVFETGHERLDRVHARLSLAGTPHEGEELDVPAGTTEANVTLAPR